MIDLVAAPDAEARALALAQALLAGGAQVLQLRMKDAPARDQLAVLQALHPLVAATPGALLIMNDRLDVALAGAAHGVHLGQDDLPLAAARRVAPAGFLIGISTHNEAQAAAALSGGADYIALGPIYPTTSKANPDPVVGVERLASLCRSTTTPVVAIGGITLERAPEVAAAGAHAAAVIAAVNQAADVAAAARQVTRAFAAS
jgi:thiamine-phosphate pyrophosphorylase